MVGMPTRKELVQALMKDRQHGQHGPVLNDDHEKVALTRQPVIGDEQMGGGGYRDKLRDSFDDAVNDNGDPGEHGASVRLE
jgi:hypothetical protein